MPTIQAKALIEKVFKPVLNAKTAFDLGMLAYDNESIATKLQMAVVKKDVKAAPPNSF